MGALLSLCGSKNKATEQAVDGKAPESSGKVTGARLDKPEQKTQISGKDSTQSGEKPDSRGPQTGTHQALRLLGRGSAADTWLFRDFKLSRPVAIKIFQRPLDYYPISAVQREVMTQTELGPGHMNLINVYQLFLTPDHLGLVMECAEGGSLTSYVGDSWQRAKPNSLVLSEDEVLYLFKQFISAVAYCHKHQIAHRDLKLDNTLLDGSDPPVLKICDFGFARHFSASFEKTKSHLGTPEYMSPELLHKTAGGEHDSYDARSTDVWASGVLLVVCLCGAFPFDHTQEIADPQDAEADLWLQEVNKNWSECDTVKQNVAALSPEVHDLLDKIFVVDPKKRIDVQGIMKHPWYQRKLSGKYQDALDELEQQQKALEKHVQEQDFDRAKVSERSKAISNMIKDAGQSGESKRRQSLVRPLHVIDMTHADLESIDLTERAVIAKSNRGERKEEPKVVKDRFERSSVQGAIGNAFSSRSDLSDAIGDGSQSRRAVGGGTT